MWVCDCVLGGCPRCKIFKKCSPWGRLWGSSAFYSVIKSGLSGAKSALDCLPPCHQVNNRVKQIILCRSICQDFALYLYIDFGLILRRFTLWVRVGISCRFRLIITTCVFRIRGSLPADIRPKPQYHASQKQATKGI